MVNKIHFGKRISVLRRKAGVSQTELAERLGVTSQAVSKWECGNAVPDIDILLELSHLYKVTINEMLEDVDLLCELTGKKTGRSGIACFVPEQERDYNIEWTNEMQRGKWIKRNWESARAENACTDRIGKQIASCDGIILEIGAGPGGKLITSTGFVNRETLAALPEEAQRIFIQKRPDIFEDLYEDTVLAGFSKINSIISGCWYTDDDESAVADLARSLGVNLKFTRYTRYCTKEQ